MALRSQFQMLILALYLALHISSITDFNLVQLLVQDLLLQCLLKITTPLEDVKRCNAQSNSIKKENIKYSF